MARKSYPRDSYSARRAPGVRTPSEKVVWACRFPRRSGIRTRSLSGTLPRRSARARGRLLGGRERRRRPGERESETQPAVDLAVVRSGRRIGRAPAGEAEAPARFRLRRQRLEECRFVNDAARARIVVGVLGATARGFRGGRNDPQLALKGRALHPDVLGTRGEGPAGHEGDGHGGHRLTHGAIVAERIAARDPLSRRGNCLDLGLRTVGSGPCPTAFRRPARHDGRGTRRPIRSDPLRTGQYTGTARYGTGAAR